MPELTNSLKQRLASREWRLNHLYWITDKAGQMVRFKMNWAQSYLFHNLHTRNDVLKARQLGISTFSSLLELDYCLFNQNRKCGIIDKTLVDAQAKLEKIKFAYNSLDHIPDNASELDKALAQIGKEIKNTIKLEVSETKARFSNGSQIRVGASLRGGTFQLLHVSELGYVAAHAPLRAREIVTGSFNGVDDKGVIIRESTHEGGKFGLNYELTKQSMDNVGKHLSALDWKFFFFPWWKAPEYKLDGENTSFPDEMEKYFEELATQNINLSTEQKRWYTSQWKTFGSLVRQEYPSSPQEAFHTLEEGSIYRKYLDALRSKGRLCADFEPIPDAPFYVSWDIGISDYMVLWLWQVHGDGKLFIVDCLQANDMPLKYYINHVKVFWEREYGPIYKHLLPHDASSRDHSGVRFDDILRKNQFDVSVVPRTKDIWAGIFAVRRLLPYCTFHERCSRPLVINGVEYMSGVNALENYQKAPTNASGVERETPLHNKCSHAADAFRTFAEAYECGLVGKYKAYETQTFFATRSESLSKGTEDLFI